MMNVNNFLKSLLNIYIQHMCGQCLNFEKETKVGFGVGLPCDLQVATK